MLFIKIKWTKTLQVENDWLVLPAANTPIVCPVRSWLRYRDEYLGGLPSKDIPVLLKRTKGGLTPFTADMFRHHFTDLTGKWLTAGFASQNYTPHSLRKGGASFFASKGVSTESIKRYGLWNSSAIELYLKRINKIESPVCKFTQKL